MCENHETEQHGRVHDSEVTSRKVMVRCGMVICRNRKKWNTEIDSYIVQEWKQYREIEITDQINNERYPYS